MFPALVSRHPCVVTLVPVVYSVLLLLAVLSPSSSDQSGMVAWLSRLLGHLGVPGSLTAYQRLEVGMNAVIVAPVGFLGSLAVRRSNWRDWTAYAFVAASCIELFRGTFLSGREAALSDVVANTAGAFLGAAAAGLLLTALALRRPAPDA